MPAWATVTPTTGAKSHETVPPLWMVPPEGVAASLLLARSESPLSRPPTSKREAHRVQIDGLGILARYGESLGDTEGKFARCRNPSIRLACASCAASDATLWAGSHPMACV